MRAIAAVIGGLVVWMLVATAANLALRAAWVSYAEVERTMNFTPAMMIARLLLGAAASVGAGVAVGLISRRDTRAIAALIAVLIVVFIPVHYGLWERFPLWYHAVFFASLALMTAAGAMLGRRTVNRGSADQRR